MKKRYVLSLASLLLWGGMSCSHEEDGDVPPVGPDYTMEVVKIRIATDLKPVLETDSTIPYTPWEQSDYLMAIPLNQEGKYLTRTSIALPLFSLSPISGVGTNQVSFEGHLLKSADSVALYRTSMPLMGLNFTEIHYETDSLFDLPLLGSIWIGHSKVDILNKMNVTLRQRASALDIKILNKTGIDLSIRKVVMQAADKELIPFFVIVDSYFHYLCKFYRYGQPEVKALYSKGEVKTDSTFTSRLPLFLVDEAILKDKAINYSIETDQDTYQYTKNGKLYLGGIRYEENITLERK